MPAGRIMGLTTSPFTYRGFSVGTMTATLIVGILIGQIGITITGPLKSIFFLMFLFAIGYGVGPQFVRAVAQDGIPHTLFSIIVSMSCLARPRFRQFTCPAARQAGRAWTWPSVRAAETARMKAMRKMLEPSTALAAKLNAIQPLAIDHAKLTSMGAILPSMDPKVIAAIQGVQPLKTFQANSF